MATQEGLPRVSRPYDAIANQLGISAEEVMARLQRMLDSGVIRRIGAVPITIPGVQGEWHVGVGRAG